MPMTKDQLLAEAMALDPAEREALAEELLRTIDGDQADIDAAWLEECRRRMEAVDRGEIGTVPVDQVMRDLFERLKR